VQYVDPVFMLARKIAGLVDKYQKQYGQKPAIMFLEKHGLFVTAGTAKAALRLVRKVIKTCGSTLKPFKSTKSKSPTEQQINNASDAIHRAVLDATGQDLPVRYIQSDKIIAAFMQRKDANKLLATPALNPDELVYANGSAMWLDNWDSKVILHKLKSLIKRGQKPAAAFVVKGIGLFVAANEKISPVIAEITTGSLFVRMHTQKFGGINPLNRRQQDFINNWEAEAFRKKIAGTKK
jgi:rhamnose utilization protein RhaD (predicted bifunctional aldolase and dehydrogenase)